MNEDKAARVLMVDDDKELCAILTQYLAIEGFAVTSVHTGAEGVDAALTGSFDLVLLDVMLPRLNGFEALRRIRESGTAIARIPVLMLTARGDAVDRIVGLEVGADDYLPKPFNERELVARMRAIMRRAQEAKEAREAKDTHAAPASAASENLRLGDLEMELAARRVVCAGREIELTALEFDLLGLLLRHAGKIVSRQTIASEVLDRELLPLDRAIDTHMHHLRRKLGPHPGGSERLKTVRSVGYIYTIEGS